MSIKPIEFPFAKINEKFKEAYSEDLKKGIFKLFLESYVKFNMAIHLAWILKIKRDNISETIRIMIIQLYQKPPSIGYCYSLSKIINTYLLAEYKDGSIWYSFSYFFKNNQKLLDKLIEYRNGDAHGTLNLTAENYKEIGKAIQGLILQPLYTSSSLFISGSAVADNIDISLPFDFDQNKKFIFIREGVINDYSDLKLFGNELMLFPFMIGDQNGNIFLWNQKSGKKGVFFNYLENDGSKLEVPNLTECTGFPYEDWKKSANPLFLNYLKIRNDFIELKINDKNIGAEEWQNDFIYLKKLESELALPLSERVRYTDYLIGLNQKLIVINDRVILAFFNQKIFELKCEIKNLESEEGSYVINNIMNSCKFLFKYNLEIGDMQKSNFYFKEFYKLLPSLYFASELSHAKSNYLTQLKLWQDINIIEKANNKLNILSLFLIIISGALCILLQSFLYALISILPIAYHILNMLNSFQFNSKFGSQGLYNISSDFVFTKKQLQKVKDILTAILVPSNNLSMIASILTFANKDKAEKVDTYIEDLFDITLLYYDFDTFKNPIKLIGKDFNEFSTMMMENDLLTLQIHYMNLKKNKISFDYLLNIHESNSVKLKYDHWKKFKKENFEISNNYSPIKIAFVHQLLNEINWFWNANRLISFINEKLKNNNKETNFEEYYWEKTSNSLNFTDHFYLLAYSNVIIGDYEKALEYFKNVSENGQGKRKYEAGYNVIQLHGYLGQIKKMILSTFNLERQLSILDNEDLGDLAELKKWVINNSNFHNERIKKGKISIFDDNLQFNSDTTFIVKFGFKFLPDDYQFINLVYRV
jgi:hypothetical protein